MTDQTILTLMGVVPVVLFCLLAAHENALDYKIKLWLRRF